MKLFIRVMRSGDWYLSFGHLIIIIAKNNSRLSEELSASLPGPRDAPHVTLLLKRLACRVTLMCTASSLRVFILDGKYNV